MSAWMPGSSCARMITCVGFDWRAEVSLKETLLLLRGKTFDRWEYSDELIADVVVYDESNALAQAMVRRANSGQMLFSSSGSDEHGFSLRPPFGASRLIRCLDHASQQLGASSASAEERGDSLAQRLDTAMRAPGMLAVAIHTQGLSGLIKPGSGTLHWPQAMSVEETAALLSGTVEVRKLSAADLPTLLRIEAEATVTTPAESLLWAIGVTRSKNTLLQRFDTAHCYRLQRWPDFGVLGRRSLDLRCAALLTQRELSLSSLSLLAGMPLGVIGGFLNAAALCGLLEETAGDATTPTLPERIGTGANDSQIGGMLRRIRQIFALN